MAVYHDVQRGSYVEERPVDYVAPTRADHGMNVLARTISFIGSVIIVLLALRFLLLLFGANPANTFVHFVYNVSRPFVQPFYSAFNYQPTFARSHFEAATLVAMVVYALVTYLLIKLATIGKHRDTAY